MKLNPMEFTPLKNCDTSPRNLTWFKLRPPSTPQAGVELLYKNQRWESKSGDDESCFWVESQIPDCDNNNKREC